MAVGRKTGGRKPGSRNKVTSGVKAAFTAAFERCGGVDGLTRWAQEEPGEFYKLYARLIPTEITGPDGGPVRAVFEKLDE